MTFKIYWVKEAIYKMLKLVCRICSQVYMGRAGRMDICMYLCIHTHRLVCLQMHRLDYLWKDKRKKQNTGCLWGDEWGWLSQEIREFSLSSFVVLSEFYYVHVLPFQKLKFRFTKERKKKRAGHQQSFWHQKIEELSPHQGWFSSLQNQHLCK